MRRLLLVNNTVQPAGAPISLLTLVSFSSLLVFLFCFSPFVQVNAQATTDQQKADYQKTITARAGKIADMLSISDSVKYKKVVAVIAGQYSSLNDLQQQNTAAVAAIKSQSVEKDKLAEALKGQEEKKMASQMQLHNEFIAHLKENLDEEQVDKVKDGMTYRVFPITYTAYEDMIPTLTTEQKEKIYGWLKEARELAMDAESSDKKHAVFGKYKGRINNYLSAAGYDMKKEGEEWQKRLQAAKALKETKQAQN